MVPSRTNGFLNMLETARKLARSLNGELPSFPSLLLTADSITPSGDFAEAQAQVGMPPLLSPPPAALLPFIPQKNVHSVYTIVVLHLDGHIRGA